MIPKKGVKQSRLISINKKIDRLQKKIEQESLLRKKQIQASQLYIELLTNFASHDIKNAVHNLDGFVSTIAPDEVSQGDLDSIKSIIKTIRSTIDDFNMISQSTKLDHFSVERLIISLRSLHRPIFAKNKIHFTIEIEGDAKQMELHQNFRALLQVINNLIVNSCKALEDIESPKLFIKIKTIDGDKLLIDVCDNGVGIPNENRNKVFQPYFSTSGGTGIGLTHVKYSVEQSGGSVELLKETKQYSTILRLIIPNTDKRDKK